jgi:hypothetical protein
VTLPHLHSVGIASARVPGTSDTPGQVAVACHANRQRGYAVTGWDGWASLGGQLTGGDIGIVRNADGRLELFGEIGGPGGPEMAHIWQTSPNNGWGDWASLGPPPAQFLGAATAAANADGRLEVFGRVGLMSTGSLYHFGRQRPGMPGARGTTWVVASARNSCWSGSMPTGGWKYSRWAPGQPRWITSGRRAPATAGARGVHWTICRAASLSSSL